MKLLLPLSSLLLAMFVCGTSGQGSIRVLPPGPEFSKEDYMKLFLNSLYNYNRDTAPAPEPKNEPEVVHEWVSLEYDWPCDYVETFYREHGMWEPEVNILSGIDVYKGDVYVTVFRVAPMIPSGLNKVVVKDGKSLLQPFPSLTMNELGDCSKLQYPFTSTTDPNTGYMYILDVGITEGVVFSTNSCPPKIVVLDLNNNGTVVRSHDLPESVVARETNLLNDLVLDYVVQNGTEVRYAYITDTGNEQLVVFDFQTNSSWAFRHESMAHDEGRVITVNNVSYFQNVSIDGIAMDPNFEYVYYCPVGSFQLSQIPTFVLRDPKGDFAANHRVVGNKVSQSDGLVYGQESLFFGALSLNAVYKWEVSNDVRVQEVGAGRVNMKQQTLVARDNEKYNWVDTLKLDSEGYLWFTTNRLLQILHESLEFSGEKGSNFRINRVYVGENSYLWREK